MKVDENQTNVEMKLFKSIRMKTTIIVLLFLLTLICSGLVWSG